MATLIDSLLVELGLDNSKFKKGSEEAEEAYEKLMHKAKASAKEITEAAKQKADGEKAAADASAKDVIAAAASKTKGEVSAAKEAAQAMLAASNGKSKEEINSARQAAKEVVAEAQAKAKAEVAAAVSAGKEITAAAQAKAKTEISIANSTANDLMAAEKKAAKAISENMKKEAEETKEHIKEQAEQGKEFFKGVAESALEFFGIMAAAAGMVEFIKGTMEAEINAGRLAKTLNVDVEELEAMEGAVKRVGGTSEGLDSSLKGLNSRLEMIAIHGPRSAMALKVFAGMGISEASLKGKDAIGVMGLLAEKMTGMSEAKAMALGEKLGLDEGTVRLLKEGKEGMAELIEKQKALGVASKEEGEQSEKFERSMLDMKDSFASVGRELMAVLMPSLLAMGKALAALGAWAKDHGTIVKAVLVAVGTGFLFVGASALAAGVQAAIAWIMALGPLNLIIGAVAVLAGGLYLLISHIHEVGHWFHETALDIVYFMALAFFDIEKSGAKAWKAMKKGFLGIFSGIWQAIAGPVMSAVNGITGAFSAGFNQVMAFADSLWDGIKRVFAAGVNIIIAIGKLWIAPYVFAFNLVLSAGKALWNGIKEAAHAPLQWIEDKLGGIVKVVAKAMSLFHGATVAAAVTVAHAAPGAPPAEAHHVEAAQHQAARTSSAPKATVAAAVTPSSPKTAPPVSEADRKKAQEARIDALAARMAALATSDLKPSAAPTANAAMAMKPGSTSHNTSNTTTTKTTTVNIGTVTTQAPDAAALAKDLPGAMQSHSGLIDHADGGL
jgi:hypothetical protein